MTHKHAWILKSDSETLISTIERTCILLDVLYNKGKTIVSVMECDIGHRGFVIIYREEQS